MPCLMSFSAPGFRPNPCYDESYTSDSDSFERHTRDQRRMFIELQRQAYMYRLHNHQSSPGAMGGSQSAFSNRGRLSPMMRSHPQFGVSSPLGMNMGGGGLDGMGGMGFGMGFGMGSGMRVDVGMGRGRGRSTACSDRLPFLGGLRMGHGQSSPFILGQSRQSHPIFTNRHRQNDQPSWPQVRRAPFSTSFLDDNENDESDYDTSTTYNYPRRRTGSTRQPGRSSYQSRPRSGWMHSYNDRYEYDDEDDDDDDDEDDAEEEDDESDFEEYYPVRRRRPRY